MWFLDKMELLQEQIKLKLPMAWDYFAISWLLQGIHCPTQKPSHPIRNWIFWELEQNGELMPTHSPIDQAGAAIGQGISRLGFNEMSEELGLV